MILTCLLTFLGFCSIFLASIYSLWKHPPVIRLDLSGLPTEFVLKSQTLVATKVDGKPNTDDAIPADVVEYCEAESDPLTRDIRKRYAKTLKNELGSWELALQTLQREDGLEIKD